MSKSNYQQRLQNDLPHWVKMGWVQPQYSQAILDDAGRNAPTSKIPMIVGILGAILLAAGVVLFVSANWQEMSKLTRLGLLIGTMWATFATGVWINRTSHTYLLEAVILLGTAIFGANIILIAQMYHIDNHYPHGLLLAGAGALLVTVLLKSRAALLLAFVLIICWATAEIIDFRKNPFWPFLPAWAIAATASYWLSFRFGLHLAFLSILAWLFASLDQLIKLIGLTDGEIAALLVLFSLAVFVYGLIMQRNNSPLTLGFGSATAKYGLIGFLLLAFISQGIPAKTFALPDYLTLACLIALASIVMLGTLICLRQKIFTALDFVLFLGFANLFTFIWFIPALSKFWLPATLILAHSIWLLTFGQKRDDRLMVAFALVAFGGQVLYVYTETLGTLLDTSLFFLLGGVLLIALSFGLEMFRRYLEKLSHLEGATP